MSPFRQRRGGRAVSGRTGPSAQRPLHRCRRDHRLNGDIGREAAVRARPPNERSLRAAFLRAGFEVPDRVDVERIKRAPVARPLLQQGARPEEPNILFERIEDVAPVARAIARIHNVAYANDAAFRPHDGDEMARVLRGAELWVARECDDMIGFCVAEPEAAAVWIESLAIDPSRKGQGIGAALLRHVLVTWQVGFGRPASLQSVEPSNRGAAGLFEAGLCRNQPADQIFPAMPRDQCLLALKMSRGVRRPGLRALLPRPDGHRAGGWAVGEGDGFCRVTAGPSTASAGQHNLDHHVAVGLLHCETALPWRWRHVLSGRIAATAEDRKVSVYRKRRCRSTSGDPALYLPDITFRRFASRTQVVRCRRC